MPCADAAGSLSPGFVRPCIMLPLPPPDPGIDTLAPPPPSTLCRYALRIFFSLNAPGLTPVRGRGIEGEGGDGNSGHLGTYGRREEAGKLRRRAETAWPYGLWEVAPTCSKTACPYLGKGGRASVPLPPSLPPAP